MLVVVVLDPRAVEEQDRPANQVMSAVNDVVEVADEDQANEYISKVQSRYSEGRWAFVIQSTSEAKVAWE